MNDRRFRAVLADVLRRSRSSLLLLFIAFSVSAAVFALYQISFEPFFYALAVTLFLALVLFAVRLALEYRRAVARQRSAEKLPAEWQVPAEPASLAEKDYQGMIAVLSERVSSLASEAGRERTDLLDYYTVWVHQIKTPIAVMRLRLSPEDTAESRALLAELDRIERYAEMALQYIRLESDANDLVIAPVPLDDLIREAVRKFAPQFVLRKLTLTFDPTGRTVITDRKWFLTILEQFLSNAVKYTQEGGVTIALGSDGFLRIRDSGIGIASADLPRIFEKGYTGLNGHADRTSSGLGLYLCSRAAELLAIPLSAESKPGEGSVFSLDLSAYLKDAET